MKVAVQVEINGSKEQIWDVTTNIENSVNVINGIEKIEILNKTENDFIGLKWRETRTLFGKTATEVMWIIDAKENEYYKTQAESHGALYISTISMKENGDKSLLTMEFSAKPLTFLSKLMYFTTGFMFKNATVKALQEDLNDIKKAVESIEK